MSQHEPDGPYVYQPHPITRQDGKLWHVGALPDGMTREQAQVIVAILRGWPAVAEAQIATLRADVAVAEGDARTTRKASMRWQSRAEQAEASLARVRVQFRNYGEHKRSCATRSTSKAEFPPCTCGLDQALALSSSPSTETEKT